MFSELLALICELGHLFKYGGSVASQIAVSMTPEKQYFLMKYLIISDYPTKKHFCISTSSVALQKHTRKEENI